MESLRGQLLIASPAMLDPNFARTVILVIGHSGEGAMGLVLNRPSEAGVVDAIPELAGIEEVDAVVHVGGPVQPTAVLLVADFEEAVGPGDDEERVLETIGLVGADELDRLEAMTRRARVFAGYAGWGPGQLESELEREDWIVEPADPDDVFAAEAGALWSSVLDRKGGRFALLARMPVDPSLN